MTFSKTQLKNGLRLITVPMPDNPSVTVLVMVEAGSKYETKEENGISHFLEHMVFKGTTKRPKSSAISHELDSIGAHYNAFTGQEFTGYYAKADVKHFDAVLDIVSDMYIDPLFDPKEIEKEKGVIIEEIKMYQDLPQQHVHDVFMELLYGDQPAGWNVAGTEQSVKSFSRDSFVKYREEQYVSSATTVIVSGSFDMTTIEKKVEDAFSRISSGKKSDKKKIHEEQSGPKIMVNFKETDQTHIVIGCRTFAINDPRIPIMHILVTILGRGMSSRLFSRLRDDLGICYYVRAEHSPFTDHGFLAISAGVDNTRVDEAVKEILGQCRKLRDEDVSEAELKKAKDYFSGTTMLELETSESRAEFCGFQEILKHTVESPQILLDKINAVTSKDIRKLAKEIFVDEGLNMALVGRYKDTEGFKPYFKF